MYGRIFPKLKLTSMTKRGLFFASGLGGSYQIFCNNQEEKKVPLHYRQMKNTRAQWDITALQGKEEASREMLARAHQIEEIYTDYYVFIHAQSTKLMPLTYLINAMAENNGIPKSSFFKYVRKPENLSSTEVEQRILNVQESKIDDRNKSIRDIMLSADAYFDNEAETESAQHFLKKNSSMLENINYLVCRILSDDGSQANFLADEIKKLSRSLEADCGNLFVFCIPKELVSNSKKPDTIFYRSHPYGRKCECSDPELGGLLADFCSTMNSTPQFRLIIPSLTPDKGVLCFMLTPFEKSHRKQIKEQVKAMFESYINNKNEAESTYPAPKT